MGISNFTLLLRSAGCKPTREILYFDSILIDIQSVIHAKLGFSSKYSRRDIVQDVCFNVVRWVRESVFNAMINQIHNPNITIVICFDGSGVPMKWPIQAERRKHNHSNPSEKDLLKKSLFEHNHISYEVYLWLEREIEQNFSLWNVPEDRFDSIRFILSSSEMDGEGEHKMFRIAHLYSLEEPLVLSVDNDVFILALMREYKQIQIGKDCLSIYHLSDLFSYRKFKILIAISFLFGNDFFPEIIGITQGNVDRIYNIIYDMEVTDVSNIPLVMHEFLERIQKNIRYTKIHDYEDVLFLEFWKNVFWMIDYYTLNVEFKQKYKQNQLWSVFDRNRFLTAAINDFSYFRNTFDRATGEYGKVTSKNNTSQEEKINYIFGSESERVRELLLLKSEGHQHLTEIVLTKKKKNKMH